MIANFSLEIMEAKTGKPLKGKVCPLRILYLVKISFKTEGEIKIFSNKQKPGKTIICSVQNHTVRNGKRSSTAKQN